MHCEDESMNRIIGQWYEKNSDEVRELADAIHDRPEVSGQEYFACMKTREFLERHGFQTDLYKIPPAAEHNCVVGRWGSGHPVIGILGEYDALPWLGQESVPYYAPVPGPGHGCGHSLMAAACASAAAAAKEAMEVEGKKGTILYYGCPAEEGGYGKVHMIQMGLFKEPDLCIAYHAGGQFRVAEFIMQSLTSLEVEFIGKSAHAACEPEMGRSALDGVQLMNLGVEFLREHVGQDTRIHYCITEGGKRPNVVPDRSRVSYYIRNDEKRDNTETVKRVMEIAAGAALMTGTEAVCHVLGGSADSLLNHTLNRTLYESLLKIPPISYTEEERHFANTLYKNAVGKEPSPDQELLPTGIQPLCGKGWHTPGSSDITDVSHVVPTVQLFGGGTADGLPGHHWSITAVTGTEIGRKGAVFAGKALAQFCLDVLESPLTVEECRKEFIRVSERLPAYEPVCTADYHLKTSLVKNMEKTGNSI